jgi:hypothetical protein
MTLFDQVDIMNTPNAFKSGKLYSVKPSSGLADLSISRSTTATRVNSAGTIETLAVNVPQLDYTDSGCPSFLVEPQRTNLAFPSATPATQTVTTSAIEYTLSFYGVGAIILSGSHSASKVGTDAGTRVFLTFTPTSGSLTMTVAEDVSLANIQLEAGGFATSLIPTTSASVTRNLTSFVKTGLSSLIGNTEGVIFLETQFFEAPTVPKFIGVGQWNFNHVSIGGYSNGNWSVFFYLNGTPVILPTTLGAIDTNFHKIAFKYKSGDNAVWLDGVEIYTSVATGTPSATAMDTFGGKLAGLLYAFEGKIKQMQVYDTILTDTELLTLTT